MPHSKKLILPKVRNVKLNRFSLYSLQPNIDISIIDGVFCLAGANGLGKSTFLAALNFGITGIVPTPHREFKSVDEYYKLGINFSKDFFTGRIAENDRDVAEICVTLQVGQSFFHVTRGIFEPSELRAYFTTDTDGTVVYDGAGKSGTEMHDQFQKDMTKAVGLESFSQFVFLQHFVFTFDESRHLLLWDDKVLNQVLYMCIGSDYQKAQEADKLRREAERAASRARNLNYQASNVRSRIESLIQATSSSHDKLTDVDLNKLELYHQSLTNEVDSLRKETESKKKQLDDTTLVWMELSSQLSTLQNDYSNMFSRRLLGSQNIKSNPIITSSLNDKRCAVCGNEHEDSILRILTKINSSHCPLCESSLENVANHTDYLKELQLIDVNIQTIKSKLSGILKGKERISSEMLISASKLETKEKELIDFEKVNEKFVLNNKSKYSGIESALCKLNDEMAELISQKDKEYAKRDEKSKALLKLQKELQQAYIAAESQFVPMFGELASLFLGIELEIRMNVSSSIASPNLSLMLEMRGSARREEYQLSESQRFFLDIALRMAIAQYVSSREGEACLFIDTPEGSLDIAYESRAGQMIAQFANNGHNVLMTANINSSQLLLRLAGDCKREKMVLHKMTTWTELSDVQLSEEKLFNKAYDEIEKALDGLNA